MCSDLQYIHVMATSREMTSGRPFPLILNFAFPLLLGNLLQQTYSLMDAAIVGKFLGINALASVGASTSVVFLILGFWKDYINVVIELNRCRYFSGGLVFKVHLKE